MVLVLSDELVDNLRTRKPQQDFYDAEFRGGSFLVRVSRSGEKSYVLAYRFRGRRRRLTLGRHPDCGLAEARREADRLAEGLRAGLDPRTSQGRRKAGTLREFYERRFAPEHVEAEGRLKESTRRHYRWAFRRHILAGGLADLPLARIGEADIERFAEGLGKRGVSEAAVTAVLNCLAACLRRAVERGLIEASPAQAAVRRARRGRRPPRPPRPLTKQEAGRLLSAADEICPESAFHLIMTALHTGMRPGELRALKWEDVDLPARRIRVRGPGGARRVALSDSLAEALGAFRRMTSQAATARRSDADDWVFPNRFGRRTDFRNFKKRWFGRAAELAGLSGLEFGSLRDTCAVLLLEAGLPLERLSAQLGEAHPGVTAKRYARWLPSGGREAFKILPTPAAAG